MIPVDAYVPGCAVKPESILDAVIAGVGILDEKAKAMKMNPADKDRSEKDASTGAHASVADVDDVPGAAGAGVE